SKERSNQIQLLVERPMGSLNARKNLTEHRRQAKDCALRRLAILAAPFGDGVESVEQEMRIEVGAKSEELRLLGLARERFGARTLMPQLCLQLDIATK